MWRDRAITDTDFATRKDGYIRAFQMSAARAGLDEAETASLADALDR